MKITQHGSCDMPQAAGDSVTFDGRTDPFADYQTDPRARRIIEPIRAVGPAHVHDEVRLRGTHPVPHRRVELSRPPHAVACRKHRQETRRCDQADSARRPLRRRFETIPRPARVRIRRRKPCTRARRRLFGWKVRLPLVTAFSSLCAASFVAMPPAAHASQLGHTFVSLRVGRVVLLLARRGPQTKHRWVAAVSPTFGRLFEGTDEPSLGQTCPAPTAHHRSSIRRLSDRPMPRYTSKELNSRTA
jgi:hypothetical protein